MKRRVSAIIMVAGMTALGLVPATAVAAPASVNHVPYLFMLGITPGLEGPDMALASNGSILTMSGQGSFQAGPDKTVSGGGTYAIADASGTTVASGAWTAVGMLGFVNYGSGVPQGAPPFFYGGQATMKVTLTGIGSGVLNVNCTLGTPPPGHSGDTEEGIDLMLGNGLTFNREVFGQTLFINPAQIPPPAGP